MKNKFSKNIEADKDGFYMACPEIVGKYIANRLSNFKSCVELCCGVGTLSIQIAKVINKVYAVDINKNRIDMARYNAKLYNVSDRIKFIQGDVLDSNLFRSISAEVAVLDPDWSYRDSEKSVHVLNIDDTQPNLRKMFNLTSRHITKNIVMRIPKTFTAKTLKEFGQHKIDNIIWDRAVKFKVAYFFDNLKTYDENDILFD